MEEGQTLKKFLNQRARLYEQPSFIPFDPISIPHMFCKKQDIEIAALFAAIFAWGNRTTIINKSKLLMALMEMQPHAFCLHAEKKQLQKLAAFKHRTFNADDLYYFIEFIRHHYTAHETLETAFFPKKGMCVEEGLNYFRSYFFSGAHLKRTEKHISSPLQKSSCKRLNMFLRWMVRSNAKGVDFGIWKHIQPADLICPLDVHVARVARHLGLLARKQTDWEAALLLTEQLRSFDKLDPVKYDFALFGMGVTEKSPGAVMK